MTDIIQLTFSGVSVGCLYALIGIGFIFAVNSVKIVNLAHGELLMVGAFLGVTAVEYLKMPVLVGFTIAILGTAVLGYILNLVIFKPLVGKPFFSILVATMGLSMILSNSAMNIWGPYPLKLSSPFANDALGIGNIVLSKLNLLLIITLVIVCCFLVLFYKRTLIGKQMRAMSEQPDAARLLGVPVRRLAAVTFMISAGLAGLAGVLMGPIYYVNSTMGSVALLKGFTAAIIGGYGKVEGAVLGGITLGVAETMMASYIAPTFKDGFAFLILILVLLVRPQGILGESFSQRV